ncbi:MAG: ornithine cyclodeaminase family protein [Vicinamibacteria bacterium]|nr:ornithine cyclodeaminase family protein [Vicinamibacteria bacterium]
MQDALLLSRRDLERVLDFPSVIDVLEQAFRAEHRREWDTPKRIAAHTKAGGLLAMPCGGGSPEALGAKLVSTFPGNAARSLPSVSGLYALFDPGTGVPLSVMDGSYLTLVRTAAVSALAARLLSRPNARTLGLLGAGAQAAFHACLLAAVRPIDAVTIWARRRDQAEALAASLRASDDLRRVSSWTVTAVPEEAAACDLVVTATSAPDPVLLGRWLRDGTHLNPIGAHTRHTREIDTEAVTRAAVLAVETADTLLEAGDFQMAEAERGGVSDRVVTLGSILAKAAPFPAERDPGAITIFKSCGVAFEDLAVASLAFRRAREASLGVNFSFARAV